MATMLNDGAGGRGPLPLLRGLAPIHPFLLAVAWAVAGWLTPAEGAYADAEYLIDSWETDQGLPENSATAMVQTADGYLWFGTFNGLVRFDGVRFVVFDTSNTPELPSSAIVNLHLDATQRLWVSTLRGLVVSEPARYTTFRREPRWTDNYVRSFSENAGVLCATSFDGKVFRGRAGQFEELPEPPGRSASGYLGHVDRAGRVWVAQPDHFFGYWDGRQWQSSELAAVVTNGLVGCAGLRDGGLLVVKSRELLRVTDNRIVSRLPWPLPNPIPGLWSAFEDRRGNLWLNSQGLYRIQPSGDVRYFCSTNGLTYDSTRFTFEDQEGTLWVGTSGGGLMRFKQRRFLVYGWESGVTERNVKAVLEDPSGRILFGTYGRGLFARAGEQVLAWERNRSLDSLWTQSLLLDRDQNLWIGSYSGRADLSCLAVVTPTAVRSVPTVDCGGYSVRALYQDSQGRIWIGGGKTVSVFAEGQFKPQTPPAGSVRLDDVRCFAESRSDGSLWAGSGSGLFRLAQGAWREVRDAADKPLAEVLCLRFDAAGALWIGGAGVGLLRFKDGRFAAVTQAHGLPTTRIGCILEDDHGYWWLGSNRGVVRASRLDFSRVADGALGHLPCQVFNLSDGLASVECTMGYQSNGLKDRQGRLWFATLKGAAMIDPRQLTLNTNPPDVHLEWVTYRDRRGARVELTPAQVWPSPGAPVPGSGPLLTIPPGSSQLEARFAVLSFAAPEKIRVRYQLLRRGRPFIEDEGAYRRVSAQWLVPGDYQLRVSAANSDGAWNHQGLQLAFVVAPFYWQTWPFWACLVLVLGGASAGTMRWRHRLRLARMQERLRQQEALADERARSAALTQHASDVITLLDPHGRISYESPSIARILGYPEGFLQGKDPLQFVHPEDQQRVADALRQGMGEQPTGAPVQYRFRHAQGHWVHLESLGRNLLEQPGVHGVLITTRDITERQRAEEALRQSEARLRAISAATFEGIGFSEQGCILDVNAQLAAMLGYTPEELVGRPVMDLVAPESRQVVSEHLESGQEGVYEHLARRKDGTTFLVEARGSATLFQGRKVRVTVIRDITQRRLADERIRQQAALLEATHDAILVWDLKQGVQFLNPAAEELTGQTLAAVQGRDLSAVLRPRSELALVAAVQEVTTRGHWSGELTLTGGGRTRDVASRWSTMLDAEGKQVSVLITCNDITEKKRLEDQYLRAQRLESVGTLASGVAHDLNNILSPITMGLGMLDSTTQDPDTRSLLAIMQDSARRGAETVQQLLTFARGTESRKGPVQPKLLVKEITRLLQQTFPKNIQICARCPEAAATVLADPSQLHQVLMNLCVNARDAMPEGGTLLIAVEHQTLDETSANLHPKARPMAYVVIKVSDSGTGIPPEVQDRIFDPFFTTKAPGKGTGLGLATVLGIVEGHGGFVLVESQPGQGSTFKVYLPATVPAEGGQSKPAAPSAPPGHGEAVLVVDDEPGIRRLAESVLRHGGYLAITAASAAEALPLFEKHRPALRAILTDIMMPFGDGRHLISLLHERAPNLPIIAMSGHGTAEFERETSQRGARAFLSKPFPPDQLLRILSDVLRGTPNGPQS